MGKQNITFIFSKGMKMADMIKLDHHLLLVLSRFEIPLGFGEKSVEEVCRQHQVDVDGFLTIANLFVQRDSWTGIDLKNISVLPLLQYLHNSHTYFAEKRFPSIRAELLTVLDDCDDNLLKQTFVRFFDEYTKEVAEHMNYEEKVVFPYIYDLLENKNDNSYSISNFAIKHNNIEEKLVDLKNLIVKYIPSVRDSFRVNNILFAVCACEEDLHTHSLFEDEILIPLVLELEALHEKKK